MAEIYRVAVTDKDSIVNMPTHSPLIQGWLQELEADNEMKVVQAAANMSWAPHRFDSLAIPLARLVLFWPAHVALAIRVERERRGTARGKAALQFLRFMNPMRMMVLALMAQAAYEGLMFVRTCDSESMDVSLLANSVSSFMKTLHTLFVSGEAFNTGFGKVMLEWIRRPLVYWDGRTPMSLGDSGGLDDGQKHEALSHLAGWVKLAVMVAEAEFPSFELVMSMQVLELQSETLDAEEFTRCTDKLALAFHVCPAQLRHEHERMRGIAMRFHTAEGLGTREAWAEAFTRTQHSASMRASYPVTALGPVLQRYVSLVVSTSGCESQLGVQEWLTPKRRANLSEQRELDELTIAVHRDTKLEGRIFTEAMAVWASLYGRARSSKLRLKGWAKKKHTPKHGLLSERE
eukprot:15431529-Alexandrium_andersonii.AAC.1